jgi:hypothetical protein
LEACSLSAETQRLFKSLLKDLRPLFKEHGFRPCSQNFILESPECWVIINFQKSRWSAPDETTFYVNVAACTRRWLGFEGKPADKMPPYYGCDWQWRVEQFGPDKKKVKQWTLTTEQSRVPGAPGLDFETWEGENPRRALCPGGEPNLAANG